MGKRPPVVVLSYSSDADDGGSRRAAIRVPPGRRPRIPAPAPALEQSPSGSKKKPRRESSAGRGRRRASVPAPSDSLKAEFDMLSEDFSECLNDLGMSGVGKSSLVHLILKGSAIARPAQTVGCAVGINHVTYGSVGGSSSNISNEAEMNFFVELWDVSGHERYKACRSIFYTQINGVIFVYDLSQRKTKTNLNKWAVEVAETGTFSAPLGSGGPGGLPVPYLVIANKVDLVPRDGTRVSSGSLVAVARQWVEKQGLLPSSEELPLRESFPGSSSLVSAAKEARYDKEAVIKFFRMLIRRRYFSNDPAAPSPWSFTPREDTILPVETLKDDVDSFQRKSYSGGDIMYDGVAPLPAQRNHTPLPTLNPQQPVSSSDNYRYHRFSSPSLTDISSNITG